MTSTLLATTLVRAGRSRSFQIGAASRAGWDAAEREGRRLIQQQHYADWHRVERALNRFEREIARLREQGWREA